MFSTKCQFFKCVDLLRLTRVAHNAQGVLLEQKLVTLILISITLVESKMQAILSLQTLLILFSLAEKYYSLSMINAN